MPSDPTTAPDGVAPSTTSRPSSCLALTDLQQWKSRQTLHDHGLIHVVGRDYEVQDRDILHIHFKA